MHLDYLKCTEKDKDVMESEKERNKRGKMGAAKNLEQKLPNVTKSLTDIKERLNLIAKQKPASESLKKFAAKSSLKDAQEYFKKAENKK